MSYVKLPVFTDEVNMLVVQAVVWITVQEGDLVIMRDADKIQSIHHYHCMRLSKLLSVNRIFVFMLPYIEIHHYLVTLSLDILEMGFTACFCNRSTQAE